MKRGFWHKRIPNLFAFLILFISIWVTSLFIQSGVIFVGRAGPDKEPQNVVISNVTDNSFTVSFTTTVPTTAAISVDQDGGSPIVVFDTRSKSASAQEEFYSHYMTVTNLIPATRYEFSILSDGETYLLNGQKYSVFTGQKINTPPPTSNPVSGKIILPGGQPSTDTVVELISSGNQPVTTLTKNDGTYIIPTNSIRTADLKVYAEFNSETDLSIRVYRGGETTELKTVYKNANPVPLITLGETYNFTVASEATISTASPQLTVPAAQTGTGNVAITIPGPSQSFVDDQPLFRGTARPNVSVKLTIPQTLSTTTESNSSGAWSYRPESPLLPGDYTLEVEALDKFGIRKNVSQQFTIFSSGSQVADSATPSATPTLTITETPLPSPNDDPTPSISLEPTISTSPTATLIPTPTFTPTPTIVVTATPSAAPTTAIVVTPPPTGSTSTIIMAAVSALLIVAGGVLLFML